MTGLIRGDSVMVERLNRELAQRDLLVTFFGSVFDIPYLRVQFPELTIDQPHVDLCCAARRLGLEGGLKHIEGIAGIQRPSHLEGLDGWQNWRRGRQGALDTLLDYNAVDTRNLWNRWRT